LLLACTACGEAENSPHSGGAESGGSSSGGDASGGDASGGGTQGSSGGDGGGSSSGGAPSGGSGGGEATGGSGNTIDQPDRPMYFMGDSENGGGYALCELFSGDLVLEMPTSTSAGATDPVSGHAIYFDYPTSEVRDVQANAGLGADCPNFVLSTTGEVLCDTSECPVFRIDELENKYCPYQEVVIDKDGTEHPLSETPPSHYALHTKPGGGFWLLGRTDASFGRWSIAPDGAVTFDGEYPAYDGAVLNLGFALDGKGAAYASANIGTVGGIIHYSADFTTSEVVVTDTDSSCHLNNFAGILLSTP
jgi:hypothetical protein